MKINLLKNSEKIEEAIKNAEGKAFRRCLCYTDLLRWAEKTEELLSDFHIPKNKRKGTSVTVCGGAVGASYKWKPYSTWATLLRGSKDWFLVYVSRDTSNNSNGLGNQKYVHLPITYKELGEYTAKNEGRVWCCEK